MSEFQVKLNVSVNLIGADWKDTVDLVDDFGFEEDEAREFITNDFFGNNEIEQCLQDHALEMCGFQWAVSQ